MRRHAILLAALLLSAPFSSAHAQSVQDEFWDAAIAGDTVILAETLRGGAVIDSLDLRTARNGRRALNWAALGNRVDAIRFLVAHGASINAVNRTGFTPLHHAAEAGAAGAVQVLMELGADPRLRNQDGLTASELAASRGNGDVVAAIGS